MSARHHPLATDEDRFGEALCRLVGRIRPGVPRDRTQQAVIAILALVPVTNRAEEEQRRLLIKTVMGFGPLGRPQGQA